ncbi:unnamed protein product [Heterosigma akashiwo]
MKDYYGLLGVPRGATQSEIKKAYFQLAKKYHPDVNKNDPEAAKKFQEVTEAYEVLGDASKRQMFDTYGSTADQQQQQQNSGGGGPFGAGGGFGGPFGFGGGPGGNPFAGTGSPFEELFREAFSGRGGGFGGGGRGGGDPFSDLFRRRPGTNVAVGLRVSLLEAAFGVTKDVTYHYDLVEGGRRARRSKTVSVDVPPGVDSDMELRLQGQGVDDSPEGPPGNLFVQIQVEEDPYFRRQGDDVHVRVPVSLAQLVLGARLDVLTLEGMVELTVKAGTAPDTQLLLKGKGVRRLQASNARGNQYVHLDLQMPRRLTERQRELMREFQEEEERHAAGGASGAAFEAFADRVQSAVRRLKKYWS